MDKNIIEDKQAYHVVLSTHNSRTSKRMYKLGIRNGPPIHLHLKQEIALTKIIGDIIIESGFHCIAYNICKDHVHLVMVCTPDELTKQIQKIKAVSSKLFNRLNFSPSPREHSLPREHVPVEKNDSDEEKGTHTKKGKKYTPLWSQKFYRGNLDVWTLNTKSNKNGYAYKHTHLSNTINYIYHNRKKHQLPLSKELQDIIDHFIVDQKTAFGKL